MQQGTRHKINAFFDRLKKNLDWRWLMALLLGVVIPASILISYPSFWQTPWGHSIFFLDVTITPVLFIVRNLTPEKSWRENRWIVMPAAFVLLVWVNSVWVQSYLSVEKQQQVQTFPTDAEDAKLLALRAAYPIWVPYDTAGNPSFVIWWDCRTLICKDVKVELTSTNEDLQLAVKNDGGLVWEKTLEVTLPDDGSEMEIFMRMPFVGELQVAVLEAAVYGESRKIGTISFEGASEAKARQFGLELAKSISVIVTIITAVFAALKQLDEQKENERRKQEEQEREEHRKQEQQKRNERKKQVNEIIGSVKDYKYERGSVAEFLNNVKSELHDRVDWTYEQQEAFRKDFEEFINKVSKASISQEHYSPETSPWTQPAIATIETLGYAKEKTKALTEKIRQAAPGYSPERYASRFPPELYPLQRRFARQSAPLPEEGKWGISDWQMRFAPFGDELNEQFKYVKDDDFPLLAAVNFQFLTSRFSHQTYYFQNAWDLRAGYYQYCRAFNSAELQLRSKQTFFVPALPEAIPIWEDKIQFQEYLLHNLAAAWLRVLANAPDITDKMGLWEIEALARLVAWHYGSASAIQVLSLPAESQIMRHMQGVKPEKAFPAGEKTRWLALRPPETGQTLYLYAQVSLGGKSDESNAVHISESLAKALEKEAVFAVCFLLAEQTVHEQVLRMSNEALLLLLNERVNISTAGRKFFGDLFGEHPFFDDIMEQFLTHADGSPGKILHTAHTVLENHQQSHPKNPYIDPDDLHKVYP